MASLSASWQRLSKRQQLIVIVGASAALIWAADAVALRPLRRHLGQLHREAREAEEQLVEALVASRQADEVNRAFSAYAAYVHPAQPTEAEMANALTEVEGATRESGMTLLNLKPSLARQGETGTISVTLESEGSPAQLVQFLNRIQRSTNLLKVTELTVRASAEGRSLRTSMVISKLLLNETETIVKR